MSIKIIALTTMLGTASLSSTEATTPKGDLLAQAHPWMSTQQQVQGGQNGIRVTKDGCTYRKTQAPGYPPRWILIVNPQQMGIPASKVSCPGML
ncbi:MAG: hypothetical protein N4A70_07700 [Pelagimonas sp.]|jgi:hypothetical protein|nr:hypothetical protein [Pelagimonas sp.]